MKKSTVFSAFLISRPVNVLISMLSIFVAAFITGTLSPVYKVYLACISGGFIAAGANTVNDYYDLEIDRINRPGRPLPAGLLTPQTAFRLSLLELLSGILLALFINYRAFLVAVFFSGLLFLYSYRLKRMPLWGNLTVSLATATAFIYGGLAVNRVRETVFPALFAFFYHFGREIIKDVQDVKGDGLHNARTFPLIYGPGPALLLATVILLFLLILTLVPFLLGLYGDLYLTVILAGVFPVILYAVFSMWLKSDSRNLGIISNVLKADMLIGLLAIYLG